MAVAQETIMAVAGSAAQRFRLNIIKMLRKRGHGEVGHGSLQHELLGRYSGQRRYGTHATKAGERLGLSRTGQRPVCEGVTSGL